MPQKSFFNFIFNILLQFQNKKIICHEIEADQAALLEIGLIVVNYNFV
jgi:hypothetical protein